jgi:hypothetical protein
MKGLYILASVALCVPTTLSAQTVSSEIPKDNAAFITKAMTAAPEAVGKNATIVRVNDKFEPTETLQKGANGFTCGIEPDTGIPYCANDNAVAWYKAAYSGATPPEAPGLIYMMTGDTGTSNHDPAATDKSHWVVTGPHLMLVGKYAAEMGKTLPRSLDPDPTQPFVMFPGHKMEHVMVPVGKEPMKSN